MTNLDFNAMKGFICDMDGVIYHGNIVLPGVADFIHWLNKENKEYNEKEFPILWREYQNEVDTLTHEYEKSVARANHKIDENED